MGVWEWHINSNAVYWSPECFRIFGVYAFDSTLEGFKALIHPEDLGPTFESAGIALRERTTFVAEFRILHADGGIRWVSTMADPVYDRDWEPLSMVGTIRDVTERRRAQDALHQRTEELRLRNAELERFNRASVGRELDMVELKQLVNDLSSQLGRSPPFALNFLEENLPGGSSS
jgi:PAS domain S-box-containing protein